MAKTRLIQSNMTSGTLAPTLNARIDLETYYNGLQQAENVIILPHGGVRRRPGLSKITDGTISGTVARIEPFVFSSTQTYLLLFRENAIDIFKDGVLQSTEVTTYNTEAIIKDLDVIQSADTVIITHEDFLPSQLQRQGSDTMWGFSTISLTNIPTFDFGSGAEPVWSVTRGYPRTCTFHGGRLWFGGSKSKINSVWGSVSNDFFNFNVGTGQPDEAIFDTLDTDQFNQINGIFSGRNLQIFTAGGEFYNSSAPIIPEDSVWNRQTSYGSIRIRPISVDGSTLYVDASTRTIRSFLFSFNEDSYVSQNASLLSTHIINDVQAMSTIRGTVADVSDFIYIVNGDGTVAVKNTLRLENIAGWTNFTTQGNFKDIAVVGKEVYFVVERNGTYFIELLKEDTYTDHNVTYSGTTTTTITTDFNDTIASETFRVIAEGSIQPNQIPTSDGANLNHIEIRETTQAEVGLDYTVTVETMPLNASTNEGQIVNLRKRVLRVIIHMYESLGVQVGGAYLGSRTFPVLLDSQATPFSGIKEIYTLGFVDRLATVVVSQTDPLPFTLLSIDTEIEGG